MHMPGFTAEKALSGPFMQYQPMSHHGGVSRRTVVPQLGYCWCSEPDSYTVCDSRGNCYEKWVCLQWFCEGSPPFIKKYPKLPPGWRF